MITKVQGDLFQGILEFPEHVVIPHVCNNIGAFGAGFVVPLGRNFPEARDAYLRMPQRILGEVEFVTIGKVTVAHMIGQDGVGPKKVEGILVPPLRYDALDSCMRKVYKRVRAMEMVGPNQPILQENSDKQPAVMVDPNQPSTHYSKVVESTEPVRIAAPMFGAGLAGGEWEFIEKMIEDIWGSLNVTIYIY